MQALGTGIDFERFKLVEQGSGQFVLVCFTIFLHGINGILPGGFHGIQKGRFLSTTSATSKLSVILVVMARRPLGFDAPQNRFSDFVGQLFKRRSIADWSSGGVVRSNEFYGDGRTRRCERFFIGRSKDEVGSSRTKSRPILLIYTGSAPHKRKMSLFRKLHCKHNLQEGKPTSTSFPLPMERSCSSPRPRSCSDGCSSSPKMILSRLLVLGFVLLVVEL